MEVHEDVLAEPNLLHETQNRLPEEIPETKMKEVETVNKNEKDGLEECSEIEPFNDIQVNGSSESFSEKETETEFVIPADTSCEIKLELSQKEEPTENENETEEPIEIDVPFEQGKTEAQFEEDSVDNSNQENGELENESNSVPNEVDQVEESATEAIVLEENSLNLNKSGIDKEAKTCNGDEVPTNKFGTIEVVHVEKVFDAENFTTEEMSRLEGIENSEEAVVEKQKSVIQDIFDDWQDEMGEEEMSSKSTDAVELELKSLMDDGKSGKEEERLITIEVLEEGQKFDEDTKEDDKKSDDPATKSCGEIVASLLKDGSLPVKTAVGLLTPPSDSKGSSKGPKGRLLTGQLSSPAVAQVMKERIREKQKSLEPPVGLDVMFVKKLTQRLSSKLAAVPPAEISDKEQNKESDNKELLAILEGDPDPDWSNVKSSSEEESNNKGNKLEREIALKQLLELPGTPTKRKRKSKTKDAEEEDDKDKEKSSEEADKESDDKEQTPSTESRAGRKRRLTEKGRVHEENSKRQKLTKTKTPEKKPEKTPKKAEVKPTPKKSEEKPSTPKKSVEKSTESPKKKTSDEKVTEKSNEKKIEKEEKKEEPKSKKEKEDQKTKVEKEDEKVKTKPMVKKKVKAGRSKELEKLLQDEGVVNILYDVEQGDRTRRLVPITKTHAKWQDMEKAEQDLRKRQEMVREAVFSSSSVSSRPKRAVQNEKPEKGKKTPKKAKPQIISNEVVSVSAQRNAAEESVIFRRHSTSSYSSAPGSPRLFSHDNESVESKKTMKRKAERVAATQPVESRDSSDESGDEKEKKKVRKSPLNTRKRSRDSLKNTKTSDSSGSDLEKKDQDVLSVVLAEAATALCDTKKTRASANSSKSSDDAIFSNKEINVKRCGKLVQLILTPSSSSKLRNGITLQAMKEFCQVLSILKTDNDCHGVILTSTGTSFCEGLDVESLLQEDKEERRKSAEKLASGVKDFISSLANFNKPIVAGVQGAAVGLGVTMLLLFDLVIASDKATFRTPYGKLGQIPEGLSILTLSHTLGATFTNELLIGGRTMTANEALTAGLVSRILWPDRFQAELFTSLKSMSEHSIQSMEATKSLLRSNLREKLDHALATECKLLVQHWCSEECQDRIKTYLDEQIQ